MNPHQLVVDQYGQMIVVDHTVWKLHLFSKDGEYINTVGEAGKGPGEYSLIHHLSISSEGNLYVLDRQLHRITSYRLQEGAIEYQKNIPLPNYSPLSIVAFYHSPSQGYIGIFRNYRLADEADGVNNTLKLFSLDNSYQVDELLAEIPGNDRIEIGSFNGDNELGNMTLLQFCPVEDVLYYSQTKKLSYHGLFLNSLETISGQVANVPEYTITEFERNFFEKSQNNLFSLYPELKDYFDNLFDLPYFLSMQVTDEMIYWSLFYSGWNVFHILGMNRQSEELITVKLPVSHKFTKAFSIHGVHQNRVYGIEMKDTEGSSVVIFDLE
jgi:hypothetical protein